MAGSPANSHSCSGDARAGEAACNAAAVTRGSSPAASDPLPLYDRKCVKFSVIICTYNYGHLLPDALRSVAAQTSRDFELLVVDDGSTDKTEDVATRFSGSFPEYRYIKKPHTGLADSRNEGVRAATGTHIAFLDADDLWAPSYLEAVRSVFQADPQVDLVYGNARMVAASGRVLQLFFPAGLTPFCGRVQTARQLFEFFPYTTPSATAFSRTLHQRVGAYDSRFPVSGEDLDWVIRAALQGALLARLDRPLVLQRMHGGNLTAECDWLVEAWLSIYSKTLQPGARDWNVRGLAQARTWKWLLPSLARYSPRRGRQLVAAARKVFPQDSLLRAAYFSTYFGTPYMLRAARWLKRSLKAGAGSRIDLSAPPEALFASLAREVDS